MLNSLFENLNSEIFTPEMINQLNEKFEAEVAVEAQTLAASKIAALEEASDKYKQFLDNACQDYLEQYKQALNDKVDMYLTNIAEQFVQDNTHKLDNVLESTKGEVLYKIFESAVDILGKDLSEIVNENANNGAAKQIDDLTEQVNELHKELMETKIDRYDAIRERLLTKASDGLTIPQKTRLTDLYDLTESNMSETAVANMSERAIKKRVDEARRLVENDSMISESSANNVTNDHELSWKHLV